ncbi:MAG TPA: phosphatidate cytidylyltransferase [bacterium]|nr:phosphatidate cytidylyltransferase [bacterium]
MDSVQDVAATVRGRDAAVPAERRRTLAQRALTAIWGVPLVLALVLAGGPWLLAGVGALIVVGLLEFYRMVARAGYQPIWEAGLAAGLWLAIAAAWPGAWPAGWADLVLPALLFYTILTQLRRGHPDRSLVNTGLTLLGVLYVAYLATFLIRLRALPMAPGGPHTAVPALLVICAVWGADSAAYFVGLAIGRHKLLPRVSPHKSREGAAAGVAAGVLVGLAFAWATGMAPGVALAVGGLCAGASIVGDLWESSIKREVGVKDAGWVLPGHGGMLDRFDGLLFAAVTGYLVMRWWLGS